MTDEKIRDVILKCADEGKVVFNTLEGLMYAPIDEFIKQPTDGLLYDLNRDRATVLTFIDDPKWINDFAVSLVITRLKELLEETNR